MYAHDLTIPSCDLGVLTAQMRADALIMGGGFAGCRQHDWLVSALFEERPSPEVLRRVETVASLYRPPAPRRPKTALAVADELERLPDARRRRMFLLWLARAVVARPTLGAELGEPEIVGDEPAV